MDVYNIICFQASELPIVFIERERLEVHMFAFTVDTLEDNEKQNIHNAKKISQRDEMAKTNEHTKILQSYLT